MTKITDATYAGDFIRISEYNSIDEDMTRARMYVTAHEQGDNSCVELDRQGVKKLRKECKKWLAAHD